MGKGELRRANETLLAVLRLIEGQGDEDRIRSVGRG